MIKNKFLCSVFCATVLPVVSIGVIADPLGSLGGAVAPMAAIGGGLLGDFGLQGGAGLPGLGNPRVPGITVVDPAEVSNTLSGGGPPKPGSDSPYATANPSILLGLTAPVFNTLAEGLSLPGMKVVNPMLPFRVISGALTIGPTDTLVNHLSPL